MCPGCYCKGIFHLTIKFKSNNTILQVCISLFFFFSGFSKAIEAHYRQHIPASNYPHSGIPFLHSEFHLPLDSFRLCLSAFVLVCPVVFSIWVSILVLLHQTVRSPYMNNANANAVLLYCCSVSSSLYNNFRNSIFATYLIFLCYIFFFGPCILLSRVAIFFHLLWLLVAKSRTHTE